MSHSNELCTFLEWDSLFFNKRIARVHVNTMSLDIAKKVDDWCRFQEIDCVYFLAQSHGRETIQIAEDFNYRQVDIRMIYQLNLDKHTLEYPIASGFTVDIANANDLETLLAIIDGSFNQTRFYFDSQFDEAKANELYRIWLERSLLDGFADRVLVARHNTKAVGFVTCKLDKAESSGHIGLVGVASEARGNKLAATLVSEAFDYFKQESLQEATVVTQGRNISANRLYQNCGFRLSEIYMWYHKWYS